jgi:hypothetical protein
MEEDEQAPKRNEEMMRRFLDGTLNLGSSLSIIRRGQPILFGLRGREKRKYEEWWLEKGIHVRVWRECALVLIAAADVHPFQSFSHNKEKNQSVNARLIVNSEPNASGRKLSRDL